MNKIDSDYCEKCGNPILYHQKPCPNCGHKKSIDNTENKFNIIYENILKSPLKFAFLTLIIGLFVGLSLYNQILVFSLVGLLYTFKNKDIMSKNFKFKFSVYYAILFILENLFYILYNAFFVSPDAFWILFQIPVFMIKVLSRSLIGFIASYIILLVSNRLGILLVKISELKNWFKYFTKPIIILGEKPQYILILLVTFLTVNVIYAGTIYEKGKFVLVDEMPGGGPDISDTLLLENGDIFILRANQWGNNAAYNIFDSKNKKFISEGLLNQEYDSINNNLKGVLLDDGRVLIVGSYDLSPTSKYKGKDIFGEIYDPKKNKVTLTGKSLSPIYAFGITKLLDGRVLIAGGAGKSNKAQIYDPKTEKFRVIGDLEKGRIEPLMETLDNGKVLVIGSKNFEENTLEEFDPKTEKFKIISKLPANSGFVAESYKLNNGKIAIISLVQGKSGYGDDTTPYISIYDPKTNKFKCFEVKELNKSSYVTTSLLNDNKIIFIGGTKINQGILKTAGIFDLKEEKYTPISHKLNIPRAGATAVTLEDGKVLIMRGYNNSDFYVRKAELFIPSKRLPHN